MKIKIICLLLFHICLLTQAQNNYKLSGKITDCKSKQGIWKTIIKLVGSNGTNVVTESDSLGFYHFNDTILKPNTAYVITTISPPVDYPFKTPYGNCPYDYCFSGPKEYLNSSDKVKFKTDDSLQYKAFIHDFCLQELYHCGWTIPQLYFKKNSIEFGAEKINYEFYETAPDTTMDCLIGFMKCNPAFVIEISGNADTGEKNAQILSEQRAKKVYDIFIEKGIDRKRLYYKGYGTKRPSENINEYGMLVGIKHGAINRRVSISLLRKDYGIIDKKIKSFNEEEEEK